MATLDAGIVAVRSIPDTVPPDNRTLGWSVLEWTADFLVQPDGPNAGDPWRYTDEQVRMVLRWYEIDDRGRFVNRRGVWRRMKGWGKDPFAASLAACELCGPCRFAGWDARRLPVAREHPAAWIQTAAVSKDQTRNTMTLFPGMLPDKTVTEYGLDLGKEIIHSRAGGRIEAVTSSPRALEGGRPSFVIANETHHWIVSNEGVEMMRAIRRNARKSRDGAARVVEITNAHLPGEGSVAESTYEAIMSAGGQLPGVYYDNVEAPLLTRQRDDGEVEIIPLPELTDGQIRGSLEATRADSLWLDVDGLLDEIRDPTTEEGEARRFYFNQIFKSKAAAWFAPGVWEARSTGEPIVDGETVVIGFDGARNGDTTAVVVATVGEYPHVDVLHVEERPEDAPLDWTADVLLVEEVVRQACRRFDVVEIVCDPTLWQRSMAVWADEGLPVVEFPQSSARMTPATQNFEQRVKANADPPLITHSGNPDLDRHVANAVVTEDLRGRRIRKVTKWSKLHIDLAVAAIMALERASQHEGGGVPNIW